MHSDPKARRSRKACQTALKSSAAFALTLSAIGTTASAQDILDPDVLPFQVLKNEIPPVDYTFGDGTDLRFYGQINPAILQYDDGGERITYAIVDNDNSSTRAGLSLDADRGDWEWFGNFEIEYQPRASNNVNQNTRDFYDQSFDGGNIRKFEARFGKDRYGRFWFGQGSMASDGSAERDLSGTTVIAYSLVDATAGGNFFRFSSGPFDGELADGNEVVENGEVVDERPRIRVKDVVPNLDGLSRKMRIRYDTPLWNGFGLRASYGQDTLNDESENLYDIVGTYQSEFESFELVGAISYARDEGDKENIFSGSLSGLHNPTGVSLTFAAGSSDQDDSDADGSYDYVKLGWERDWIDYGPTAFAVDYYGGQDFNVKGSTSSSWSLSAVQGFGAGQFYATWRNYSYNDDFASYSDGQAIMGGLRIRF